MEHKTLVGAVLVALGLAGCGGTGGIGGTTNAAKLHNVGGTTDCGVGVIVTTNGIVSQNATFRPVDCNTAAAVGVTLFGLRHIDVHGLNVKGWRWNCHEDDSLKDGGDAVCDTQAGNRQEGVMVARVRIMGQGRYTPAVAPVTKPKPQPVARPSTSTTTTSIRRPVQGTTQSTNAAGTNRTGAITSEDVQKAEQALAECRGEDAQITLQQLEQEAATSLGIQC
jgi:hypothetical protein